MVNVIADIAGHYKTLQALLKKMPDDEPISLGDMVDRGPRSKEVLDFFMNNGKAVLGNHEHMMLSACRGSRYYNTGLWQYNGGDATLRSYGAEAGGYLEFVGKENVVPEEVLEWLETLPLYIEMDDYFLSHSFVVDPETEGSFEHAIALGKAAADSPWSIIWNRREPSRWNKYKLQLSGHNSQFGLRRFSDDNGDFAICLDDSSKKVLTGIHLPSEEIFQQEYID